MSSGQLYSDPIKDVRVEDCYFYHCMEIPGVGRVGTDWDLTDSVDAYLGNLDFRGKRVLDVGTAGGFLTFEMEARGADVVSFDMDSGRAWNIVPQAVHQAEFPYERDSREAVHRRLKNAYWFAHEKMNSKARVHYGDVYNLPLELGDFDVVYMGMILPHLRDPYQAIYSASRLAADTLVITNPGRKSNWTSRLLGRSSQAKFLPSRKNDLRDGWWALTDSCIARMVETMGFDVVDRISSHAVLNQDGRTVKRQRSISIVAKRVEGWAEGISLNQDSSKKNKAA